MYGDASWTKGPPLADHQLLSPPSPRCVSVRKAVYIQNCGFLLSSLHGSLKNDVYFFCTEIKKKKKTVNSLVGCESGVY